MTASITPPATAHGTYRRYQKHLKTGEEPCAACRAAGADYVRTYRATNPQATDQHNQVQYARRRALAKLAELHPQDMRRLYDTELRAAGLL